MATKRPDHDQPPSDRQGTRRRRPAGWWLAVAVALLAVNYLAASKATRGPALVRVPYSPFFTRQIADGNVSSWAEHDEAIDAAWAAPGVKSVRDNMTVAY